MGWHHHNLADMVDRKIASGLFHNPGIQIIDESAE
jgi:hypothetical protein